MTYGFKNTPIVPRSSGDGLIATALDGVVYTENSRLHVKGNTAHYVYKTSRPAMTFISASAQALRLSLKTS